MRPQFSLVQDGVSATGKAHMRSTPSLRSFPNVAFGTVRDRYIMALIAAHLNAKVRAETV